MAVTRRRERLFWYLLPEQALVAFNLLFGFATSKPLCPYCSTLV